MYPLILDIETVPYSTEEIMATKPPIVPPKNYKDPKKIEAYIKEKAEGLVDDAALDWTTAWVCCAAMSFYDRAAGKWKSRVEAVEDREDEKELLTRIFDAINKAMTSKVPFTLVGFNIKEFDLRFLFRRGVIVHGFGPEKFRAWCDISRPRYAFDRSAFDLRECFTFGERYETGTLGTISRMAGFGDKKYTGRQFYELLVTSRQEAEQYALKDIQICQHLLPRFHPITGYQSVKDKMLAKNSVNNQKK